jgi:hypothetical protein
MLQYLDWGGLASIWVHAEGSPSAGGSVWVSWATGNTTFYPNPQAPFYPNATFYAPKIPDPASVASVVSTAVVHVLLACMVP